MSSSVRTRSSTKGERTPLVCSLPVLPLDDVSVRVERIPDITTVDSEIVDDDVDVVVQPGVDNVSLVESVVVESVHSQSIPKSFRTHRSSNPSKPVHSLNGNSSHRSEKSSTTSSQRYDLAMQQMEIRKLEIQANAESERVKANAESERVKTSTDQKY